MRRFSALILMVPLFLLGCGQKMIDVNGQLTLDGAPVSGAMLTFVSTDGTSTYFTAMSDASGNFTVVNGENKGMLAGSYKVTVTKTPKGASSDTTTVGDADYMKDMKAGMDANKGKTGAGSMMKMGPGGKPMMTGGNTSPTSTIKSELPVVYAVFNTTTFTCNLPGEAMPLKYDMKGEVKKK